MIQRGYKVEVNLHREVSETRLNPMKDYKYFLMNICHFAKERETNSARKKKSVENVGNGINPFAI